MDTKLTAEELLNLSTAILKFAEELSRVRIEKKGSLDPQQDADIRQFEDQLFILSRKLNAISVGTLLEQMQQHLKVLKDCTAGMNEAAEKIRKIKNFITLATKAVALVGVVSAAVASGNALTMIGAAVAVLDAINGPKPKAAG